LRAWFVLLGEIEGPVGVNELVAKIDRLAGERGLEQVIARNAVRPHQQEEIRCLVRWQAKGREFLVLPRGAALNFSPNFGLRCGQGQGDAVGMENESPRRALDVQGPAIVAALALVGDDGIRLRCSPPRGPQIGQRLFREEQFGVHLGQRRAGVSCRGGAVRLLFLALQRRFLRCQVSPLVLESLAQIASVVLFGPQPSRSRRELFAHCLHLAL
jgi:hypothetical protein